MIKEPPTEAWCESYLPYNLQGTQMKIELRKWRNRALMGIYLQIVASLTGVVIAAIRKTRFYIAINVLSLMLAFIGLKGVLEFKL